VSSGEVHSGYTAGLLHARWECLHYTENGWQSTFIVIERSHTSTCYPIGQENLTPGGRLTRPTLADGRTVRAVTLPLWVIKLGLFGVLLIHKLQEKEGGLNLRYFAQLQTAETFLDPQPSKEALGYQTSSLDEAFRETVRPASLDLEVSMETIGLIAAMPQESAALLRCIKVWKRTTFGPFRGARFKLLDQNCLLVTSGMGLKRAMDATRTLLTGSSPHLLVSFGIAGTVNDDLNIGDVVVARDTCLLDKDLPGHFQSLTSLSEAAWDAAAQVLQPDGARLVYGTAITTRGSQVVPEGLEEMPHPVLEMETAGIAQIAAEMGIPLLSIRSISDGPQSPIPLDLEAMLDEKYNLRIGRILWMVLRRPQIIFQSRQMLKNVRKAADYAARVLVAILSQPSPVISP